MTPAYAASAYQSTTRMTAGKIPSMILLLERLQKEIPKLKVREWDPNAESLIRCQNIVAQLQMALDFDNGQSATELFDVYDLLYESLSTGTSASLRVAQYLNGFLLELFRILPRL